jgi:hypothetical protein
MLHRRPLIIICGVLLALTGCGPPQVRGSTPEDTVANRLAAMEDRALGFAPVHTRTYGELAVVLYRQPNSPTSQNSINYYLVHRDDRGWYATECCDLGGGSLTTTEELDGLVQFVHGSSIEPSLVYGYAVDPRVAAVEATFDNGDTVRQEIEEVDPFVLLSMAARNVCIIRAMDPDEQILAESRVSDAAGCPH